MKILAAVLLIVLGSVGVARAEGLMDRLLGMFSGSAGHSYTFVGWLTCTDEHVLGGCSTTPDGVRVYQAHYFGLTANECLALLQAAKATSSRGGSCL